jgi:hypothetical protein
MYAPGRPRFRSFVALGTGAFLACASPPETPQSGRTGEGEVLWSYDVHVDPELDLDVDAALRTRPETVLAVDEDVQPFVQSVARRSEAGGVRVRYRVRLGAAARTLRDVDTAYASGGAVFAPPSSWLLRPATVPARGRFRVRIATAPGVRFATALHRTGDSFEADVGDLDQAAFAAFGALRLATLHDRPIAVAVAPDVPLADAVVVDWLTAEARAIEGYSLRPSPAVLFVARGDSEVMRGKTLGDGGAAVLLRVGTSVSERNLLEDWVAAHELVHVAFPALDGEHAWFSEGLATYVEPIARVRAGLLSAARMWSDLCEGLPQGVPAAGATGLTGTHERERVYWGGALYFLLADIRIRERTRGARSLEDALRGISGSRADRANVESHWPIDRVLAVGDGATGTTVLAELYREMAGRAYRTNLDELFARLGVRKAGESVTFDESAPLAPIRRGITEGVARGSAGR